MAETTTVLTGKRVVVTGCGYNPVKETFYDVITGEPSHDVLSIGSIEQKLNMGAATAHVLAERGAAVHMVSTSQNKLDILKESIRRNLPEADISYSVVDLLNVAEVHDFVQNLPKDKPLYWVQSVGLGAGSYKLENDNPYLPLEEISLDFLESECRTVLRATHLMMRELLPGFRKQKETRVAIISSMSAIRGYSLGGSHCAAKGAIDRYANAAMLGLYKDNIFVTTVRPGAIDTGLYDNPISLEAARQISDQYQGIYRKHFAVAPPRSVGEAIAYAFTTKAHIPSINLVAQGQWPHEGS